MACPKCGFHSGYRARTAIGDQLRCMMCSAPFSTVLQDAAEKVTDQGAGEMFINTIPSHNREIVNGILGTHRFPVVRMPIAGRVTTGLYADVGVGAETLRNASREETYLRRDLIEDVMKMFLSEVHRFADQNAANFMLSFTWQREEKDGILTKLEVTLDYQERGPNGET